MHRPSSARQISAPERAHPTKSPPPPEFKLSSSSVKLGGPLVFPYLTVVARTTLQQKLVALNILPAALKTTRRMWIVRTRPVRVSHAVNNSSQHATIDTATVTVITVHKPQLEFFGFASASLWKTFIMAANSTSEALSSLSS